VLSKIFHGLLQLEEKGIGNRKVREPERQEKVKERREGEGGRKGERNGWSHPHYKILDPPLAHSSRFAQRR
jgi:ribosomal protein L19E